MKKNDEVRLTVTGMNDLGYGIGHIDGKAVFVRGAVAGDEATVKIIKDAKNYFVGKCEEVTAPSRRRAPVDCRYFPACGGCAFRHVTYDYEKELKREFVASYMRKEGLADLHVLPVMSTGQICGYRNKVQFPFRAGKMGYFAAHSHRVASGRDCALNHPAFTPLLNALAEFFDKNNIPAYDEQTGKGLLRHVVLRCTGEGREILLTLVLTRAFFPEKRALTDLLGRFDEVKGLFFNVNPANTNVIFGREFLHIYGEKTISDNLLGCSFELSPASFYQVNRGACELLYKEVIARARPREGETVADLFCGVGTIGICVKKHAPAGKLIGVEIEEQAVENAKRNAVRNGVTDAEFVCGDANHPALERADVVIVDPPRKGLDEALIAHLTALPALKRIVYVSCAPDTLARDLSRMRARGWEIGELQPVDMFPRTGHVETVVLLSRNRAVHHMKLNPEPYEMIKSGQKTIELRLFDEKRRKIKEGDQIVFTNTSNGKTLHVFVSKLHRFESFDELYDSLPLLKCGYTEETIANASSSDMEQYYSVEDQKKYGVIGIEVFRPRETTDETAY